MPERCHVYANLVSASGFDVDVEERELAVCGFQPLPNLVMRDGCAAADAPYYLQELL